LLSVAFVDYNDADGSQTHQPGTTKLEVDLSLLVKLLEAYGSLRLLKPDSPTGDGQVSFALIFFVFEADIGYLELPR
jgi:hypothetical protein